MDTHDFKKLRQPIALVVDDEPLILMNTAEMVADEGYAIVEASTADQAYAFLEKHSSLQLLFTDVQMPGKLDGFALANAVAERWPHIRVIIASGAAQPAMNEIPANATFIPKPFSAQLVHAVIKEQSAASTLDK